jgi:hypothetical protein
VPTKNPIITLFVYFLIATLATLNFGCTSKRSLPIDTHLDLYTKKIALVPSSLPIQNDLDLYAKGRLEGALKGAGEGATATLGSLDGGSCEGAFCGVIVLLYLAAVVVGGTAGAIYGAVTSPSGKTVNKMEETLGEKSQSVLTQMTFAQLLQEKISQEPSINIDLVSLELGKEELRTKGYEKLKLQGFQELISLELTEIEFEGGKGEDPLLALTLKAVVEIIDLDHREKPTKRTFRYSGPKAYYSEWIAKDADEIQKDFELSVRELIDDIYYGLFVTVDLQIPSGYYDFPGTGKYGCCWICPEDPPLDYSFWKMSLQYPLVNSVRPTLKWSSFPDKHQENEFFDSTGYSIKNVRYDLKIWQFLRDISYQVTDLSENYHTLEEDLEAHSNYYWSVRACFEIKEKKVCTRWSSSTVPYRDSNPFVDYCERQHILLDNFYRFRTP